ncbi:MAG: FAD-dependent oxidoreductase [Chloroflexi bacterium]|nr:FAD-dependent oxidoreductase [Chloroflexota bacterium]
MLKQPTTQRNCRSFDCIVVGARNGGLGAAAQLAAKGVKVLLLEQHNVPGGFATSFVRGRPERSASCLAQMQGRRGYLSSAPANISA